MDKIRITNLKVFAHHGVYPQETRDGQDFFVNAELYLDTRKAGMDDCLEESVNYGEACRFITQFLTENTYRLIEAAAERLAEAMLCAMPLLSGVKIELCKPHAPIGLPFGNVSVEIERRRHTAYLSVGSNMGDKEAFIRNGIAELDGVSGVRVEKVSKLILTKPYGGVAQDDFLNGAVEIGTLLTPRELLDALHEIERHAGRERLIRWGPRTLDLDILFYDDLVCGDAELVIPHVDMENRGFVLGPLMELCPNYRHPVSGQTVAQMYARLQEKQEGFV